MRGRRRHTRNAAAREKEARARGACQLGGRVDSPSDGGLHVAIISFRRVVSIALPAPACSTTLRHPPSTGPGEVSITAPQPEKNKKAHGAYPSVTTPTRSQNHRLPNDATFVKRCTKYASGTRARPISCPRRTSATSGCGASFTGQLASIAGMAGAAGAAAGVAA